MSALTRPFLYSKHYLCYGFFSYVCILLLIFEEMAIIRPLNGVEPKIGRNCFIAENAAIIGDVEIGDDCSIWYGAVLRGDVNPIRLGNRVNIQDGAVLHTLYKKSVVEIGNDVSVGHNAVIHGAKVGNDVLVGMGAILMDGAEIADGSIIAAGAVVLSNSILEPGVYAGVPAKKVKEGTQQVMEAAHRNAQGYMKYKEWFLNGECENCQ